MGAGDADDGCLEGAPDVPFKVPLVMCGRLDPTATVVSAWTVVPVPGGVPLPTNADPFQVKVTETGVEPAAAT